EGNSARGPDGDSGAGLYFTHLVQPMSASMTTTTLIDSIAADAESMAAVRRDLHAHPELCFQEQRTSDLVARLLTEWGIPIHRGLGKTGVVGILKNGTSKRAIGLRADMDALP